jgi:hypothetical protein
VDPITGLITEAEAIERAQEFSLHNKAYIEGSEPVELLAADVEVIDGDKVHVTVRRQGANSVLTHFAGLLGIDALEVTADATAQIVPAGEVFCGTVPLAAVPTPGEEFQVGCGLGYKLKLGAGAGVGGNYYALRLPECANGPCADMNDSGADVFRCLIANSYCCSFSVGQVLETEPGNMSGPTRQGIHDRFDADDDNRQNICFAEYTGNGQRVIHVPITTPPDASGSTTVTILGFAAFFIKRIPNSGQNSTIEGEFLNAIAPASGGGPVAEANLFAIRLIE